MSAFIVSTKTLTTIRNWLVNESGHSVDDADKFVTKLARANRYAFRCRYGETHTFAEQLPRVALTYVSDEQLLMHLVCLRYQCSEGNTRAKHAKTLNKLDQLIGEAALEVATNTKAYWRSTWG